MVGRPSRDQRRDEDFDAGWSLTWGSKTDVGRPGLEPATNGL
jgi:hypothetical protein